MPRRQPEYKETLVLAVEGDAPEARVARGDLAALSGQGQMQQVEGLAAVTGPRAESRRLVLAAQAQA